MHKKHQNIFKYIHQTIKFWGRKDPQLFDQILDGGKKLSIHFVVLEPFLLELT